MNYPPEIDYIIKNFHRLYIDSRVISSVKNGRDCGLYYMSEISVYDMNQNQYLVSDLYKEWCKYYKSEAFKNEFNTLLYK